MKKTGGRKSRDTLPLTIDKFEQFKRTHFFAALERDFLKFISSDSVSLYVKYGGFEPGTFSEYKVLCTLEPGSSIIYTCVASDQSGILPLLLLPRNAYFNIFEQTIDKFSTA